MKVIYEKWWNHGNKVFSIINYKDSWEKNGIEPRIELFTNGARKRKGDKCFDLHLTIRYTVFNYCNYNMN